MENNVNLQDLLDTLADEKFKRVWLENGVDILGEKLKKLEKECSRLQRKNRSLKFISFASICYILYSITSERNKKKHVKDGEILESGEKIVIETK